MFETIIEYLNRLDTTILILDINGFDNIFKNLISNKGSQVFSIINQFKRDFELKSSKSVGTESQPYNKKDFTKNEQVTWTQMYLLFHQVISWIGYGDLNPDQISLFQMNRHDPVCRYEFKRDYSSLYDYLSQFETLQIDLLEPQFYLTDKRWGYDWYELYYYMSDNNSSGILSTIEDLVRNNKKIDIIKVLELTEKYGIDYADMEGDYYRETLYNLVNIDDVEWKEIQIKLVKFLYNRSGDNTGITLLWYPKLFKFRGHDEDSDIKNTYGPVDYYDLQELTELWTDDYENTQIYKELMDETLKFIASDNPQFNFEYS